MTFFVLWMVTNYLHLNVKKLPGASFPQQGNKTRSSAATYLWWELGTSSAHLEGTHTLIQLIRSIFDVVAPKVGLITETNVPHADNISYFGDGANEG